MSYKKDPELGKRVHDYLVEKGVETPFNTPEKKLSNEKKKTIIAKHFKAIMETLELDLANDSLTDTPERVAKMYVEELYSGLDYNNFPKITVVDNSFASDLVIEHNLQVDSTCEHHFVTIDGLCHIAYIPNGKVIGLSKFQRIVNFFADRPQVQERLTTQIQYAIQCITGSEDVAVIMNAKHYCMKMRGVKSVMASTTTPALGGKFKTCDRLRAELYSSIAIANADTK